MRVIAAALKGAGFRKPLILTWEQCEDRGFHAWDLRKVIVKKDRTAHLCRTCGSDTIETMRRRKAGAEARKVARLNEGRERA